MASGDNKTDAVIGRPMVRLGRRGVGVPATLLAAGMLCCAAIAFSRPAAAQVPAPVGVSNAITGNTTLSGPLNGNNGAGYFVTGTGTLTINNGTVQNFTTSGGSGSGGGLGAGGAIFIDTGGTVILNGTSFSHDTAVGGIGGTSSPYGGTLNNIQAVTAPDLSPNGANGVNGIANPVNTNMYNFGDGQGNGVSGYGVTNGASATNGFGGIGGVGGPGGNGWTYNPIAEENNDIAIANVAAASISEGALAAQLIEDIGSAVAEYSASANPFEDPLSPISATAWALKGINDGLSLGADTTALASAVLSQEITQGTLDAWTALYNAGLAGNGGNGENGGNGGNSSYGFGGGAGGQGGAYGLSQNPNGSDGTGGNGGNGGAGGFGGGGGAGGYGFGADQNGCGNACNSSSGAGGTGGAAGFGGGVGSTGGATGVSNATGGGGGDGYGGAIFVNTGGSLTITGNATFAGNSAVGGASLNGGLAGGSAGTDIFMMQGSTVNIAPGTVNGASCFSSSCVNVVTFNGTIADNSSSSIGAPSVAQTAGYPVSGGAYLTIFAGTTVFNGANTYSGQTVINGGALAGPLNPGTNTSGAPNYALTDGALQAADGIGLPTTSNLNFSGPGQYTGGVLQSSGTFSRYVSPNPNPDGGGNPGGVQWTGSGGFAAINGPLTVTLNGGAPLTWGMNGFVPFGYSLIFGSATSNNSVTFTNPIDISCNAICNGNTASILVGNNGNALGSTAIMAGVISGSSGLSIGGGGFNGTLVLAAANTYTGATVVNSGTLAFSGAGSIADSSNLMIASGAGLDISLSTGVTVPTLTGSGNVFLGSQELTVAVGGAFSGVLADGGIGGGTKGSLIIQTGTETLSNTNTYTGDTTIDAPATLALVGTGSIANSFPVLDNGTFDISQTALGAAITSLSSTNTSAVVNLGSKLLAITNGSTTFAGDINDGGLGGSLMVVGGTQTLSGTNGYTGATIIDAGAALALSGNGSIASSSAVDAVGTFDISQTNTGASIKTLLGTGNVALGGSGQTLTITNASTTFAGVIADGGISLTNTTGGNLRISGGIETLTGTNTYTGTTTIDGPATLALAGTGSISRSSNIINNGLFDISQVSVGTGITTLSGAGQVALGSTLLLITNGSTTFSGGIADTGGAVNATGGMLAVTGGVQTLSGTNTYTGGTLIGGGATLALSGGGSIADSAVVFDNGTFDISQTTAGASITTLMGNGLVSLGMQELKITNGSTIFAGVIADGGINNTSPGSLTVTGGTQTLSGANTYTGTTTIDSGGKVALAGPGTIATSSAVLLQTGGTFDISQTTAGASIKTLGDTAPGQAGNVFLGAQALTITAGSTTFSGVIADGGIVNAAGGSLTVSGGTQTLGGINTYTGPTSISPNPSTGTATLALTGVGSIATSSGLTIATNGIFDISGTTGGASITTLSGSGAVALGSQTLSITAGAAGPDGTDPAGIFSGVIGGLGGMAITGGHQELTGVNTYLGGTLVTNGATLSVNSSSSLGASTSLLTLNNGTLLVNGSITIPQPISVIGPAGTTDTINLNTNNVTLTGNITGNGTAILSAINGGTLNLNQTAPNSVSNLGGLMLGPGTSLTTSAAASAGLATTPIIVVPGGGGGGGGGGAPADLFTGSVHVVGPLDVVATATGVELIILPGDTLAGAGSVNVPTVIQAGGTNAPGDGPATITSPASLVQNAGSTYAPAIDGPLNTFTNCPALSECAGQYSSTVVTGAGNTYTAGGTLAPQLTGIGAPANNTYIPPVTTSFVIVQAAGGVLGSFSSITQPAQGVPGVSGGLPAGTRFDALYGPDTATAFVNANAITLYVTPANYQNLSYWGVSLNQNESQIAGAVNALRGTAGLRNSPSATIDLGALFAQQPSALPHDFDTLTGEANADAAHSAFQIMSQFLELMLEPAVNGRNGSVGAGALGFAAEDTGAQPIEIASAYGQVMPAVKAPSFDQRWRTWGSAYGAANTTNGDTALGTHDLTASAYGFVGGMDYRWTPDNVVGFAIGSGSTQWGLEQALGSGRSYGLQVGAYTKSYFGSAYLATSFGFANQWMTTDRNAFTSEHLTAEFMAETYGARVEAGYRYATPWANVTPYAAGQAQAFYTPSYVESDLSGGTAGSFALAYNAATAFDVSSEIGARFDSIMPFFSDMQLAWRGRLAWQHEWLNNPALTASFNTALLSGTLPGSITSFTVNGAQLPPDSAIVSTGFDVHVTPSLTVGASFDSALALSAQTYGGTATLRYRW